MLGFLLEITKPFWGLIVGAAGLVLAVLGAYFKGRREQATKGKIAAQKETIDAYKKRDAADRSVATATPAERERLRRKWTTRDN